MAKIKPKVLKFNPPTSPDAESANIRIVPTGDVMDYPVPVAHTVTDLTPGSSGKIEVDLGGISTAQTMDGVYDIGVTYVDDVGNESAIAKAAGIALDFIAPDAPTGLEVV